MSNVGLLKLKDHLTIAEAGAYLVGVMGVEDTNSFSHIAGLVNEYKLNLYLNPDRFSRKDDVFCGLEFMHSKVTLRGEQKFINVYLSSYESLTIFDEGGATSRSQEYSIFIDEGSKVEGDIFVGRAFEDGFLLPHLKDDEIAKAHRVACTVYKNKVSEFIEGLHQTDSNQEDSLFHIDGSNFLYIKRKEIDALVAASQPEQKPNKKSVEYKYQTQDRLILEQIKALGYDPQALPERDSGKPGIKAEIRELLDGQGVFEATSAFKEAWKRLRRQGDLAELNY